VTTTTKTPTFTEWLARREKRDSPIGDLARDMKSDRCWPVDVDSLEGVLGHLFTHRACSEAEETARSAWRQYRKSIKPKENRR
jgi:YozE SAM-like fold